VTGPRLTANSDGSASQRPIVVAAVRDRSTEGTRGTGQRRTQDLIMVERILGIFTNPTKKMVGTRGLEPRTSTVSR
jgi:hypothetical protein